MTILHVESFSINKNRSKLIPDTAQCPLLRPATPTSKSRLAATMNSLSATALRRPPSPSISPLSVVFIASSILFLFSLTKVGTVFFLLGSLAMTARPAIPLRRRMYLHKIGTDLEDAEGSYY